MSNDTCWVGFDILEAFMFDVFTGIGVPEEDARICTEILITADKRGIDSHGIGRLKTIYYDRIVKHKIQYPTTKLDVVRDKMATAVLDANHGMGMVASKRAMEMAIEKAATYGVGVVSVRNSTHYGIAGYYALMACEAGMIGLTATNARPSIAPTFGTENMLGTNPLVFGFPTDEEFHFTNDYATSIVQRGRIEQYQRENRKLPPGLIVTNEGTTMTDPNEILKALVAGDAALAPVGGLDEETGGHKGYGFATVTELLSCALQQGAFMKQLSGFDDSGNRIPYALGHFFMAIDVSAFTDLDSFKKTTGDLMRQLRASRKAPGQDRIYTCGEKEYLAWLERKDKGAPIPQALQQQLIAMRDELGLTQYKFPFET